MITFQPMEQVPKIFDWVIARSKCDLMSVFHLLKEIVDSDVKSANALGKRDVKFTFSEATTTKFIAGRTIDMHGIFDGKAITFEAIDGVIKVKESRELKDLFSAVPNFTVDGECLLAVDGVMMRPWQVSQKALENLFFGF